MVVQRWYLASGNTSLTASSIPKHLFPHNEFYAIQTAVAQPLEKTDPADLVLFHTFCGTYDLPISVLHSFTAGKSHLHKHTDIVRPAKFGYVMPLCGHTLSYSARWLWWETLYCPATPPQYSPLAVPILRPDTCFLHALSRRRYRSMMAVSNETFFRRGTCSVTSSDVVERLLS